jgi:hypothetical protein
MSAKVGSMFTGTNFCICHFLINILLFALLVYLSRGVCVECTAIECIYKSGCFASLRSLCEFLPIALLCANICYHRLLIEFCLSRYFWFYPVPCSCLVRLTVDMFLTRILLMVFLHHELGF